MELSFRKGDQFLLVGEADENWYNVTDLSLVKSGVVPISYFKVITPSYIRKRHSLITLHGKVLYDFEAMSTQELQVSKDEYVTICAHSGNDWYIAKPVSRLGGPGLVPVSYIGVLDMTQAGSPLKVFDAQDIINSKLPTVEMWNRERDEYKKSATPINNSHPHSQDHHTSLNRSETYNSTKTSASLLDVADTHVIRSQILEKYFIKDDEGRGKYWYSIELTFNNGLNRIINRCYEDFFDFQAHLKKLFPRDASEESRILPTIPGPLANVSAIVAEQRLNDLNNYLYELLELPARISHCKFVLSFFDIKYVNDRNVLPDHLPQSSKTDISEAYPTYQQYQAAQQQQQQQVHQPPQQQQQPQNHQQQHQHQPQPRVLQDTKERANFTSSRTSSSHSSPHKLDEKFKFYFNDDIFVLKLNKSVSIMDLRSILMKRCNLYNFKIIYTDESGSEWEINTDNDLISLFEVDSKRRKLRILET